MDAILLYPFFCPYPPCEWPGPGRGIETGSGQILTLSLVQVTPTQPLGSCIADFGGRAPNSPMWATAHYPGNVGPVTAFQPKILDSIFERRERMKDTCAILNPLEEGWKCKSVESLGKDSHECRACFDTCPPVRCTNE